MERTPSHWLSWIAVFLVSLLHVRTQSIGPAWRAATATELRQGLRAGARHIVITRHLDLSQEAHEWDGPESGHKTVFVAPCETGCIIKEGSVRNTTFSIQGQCDSEVSPAVAASEAPRKPGQCVITLLRSTFMLWWFNSHPFYLHNLYFRAATRVVEMAAHTAPVLLSHVTVQRTGKVTEFDTNEDTAVLLLRMPSVLLQDCVFQDLRIAAVKPQGASRINIVGSDILDVNRPFPAWGAVAAGYAGVGNEFLGAAPTATRLERCSMRVLEGVHLSDESRRGSPKPVFYTDAVIGGPSGWTTTDGADVRKLEQAQADFALSGAAPTGGDGTASVAGGPGSDAVPPSAAGTISQPTAAPAGDGAAAPWLLFDDPRLVALRQEADAASIASVSPSTSSDGAPTGGPARDSSLVPAAAPTDARTPDAKDGSGDVGSVASGGSGPAAGGTDTAPGTGRMQPPPPTGSTPAADGLPGPGGRSPSSRDASQPGSPPDEAWYRARTSSGSLRAAERRSRIGVAAGAAILAALLVAVLCTVSWLLSRRRVTESASEQGKAGTTGAASDEQPNAADAARYLSSSAPGGMVDIQLQPHVLTSVQVKNAKSGSGRAAAGYESTDIEDRDREGPSVAYYETFASSDAELLFAGPGSVSDLAAPPTPGSAAASARQPPFFSQRRIDQSLERGRPV